MKNKISFIGSVICIIALISAVILYDNSINSHNQKTFTNEEKQDENTETTTNEVKETVADTTQTIYCIGDDQTVATKNKSYATFLNKLVNRPTQTIAADGITTRQLAQELGVTKVTLSQNIVIPASTDPVNLPIKCSEDIVLGKYLDLTNPVSINDIEGTLAIDQTSKNYTFTRSEAGKETSVEQNTQVIPHYQSINQNNKDNIYIIFTGYNDTLNESVESTIKEQQAIIDSLNSDRYIVVGFTFKTKFERAKSFNDTMSSHYGNHFLNYRYRLLTEDLTPYGVNLTEQDQQEVSNNFIPQSLRSGEAIGNDLYNEVLAKMIQEKIKELQYIQ